MNKNIKLAVAGAVLALSATAANAGIIIPAGDWTLDVSGNVNSFASWQNSRGSATVIGGLAGSNTQTGTSTSASQSTGLLPNFLSVAGSTRQNDLDVTFLISLNPGGRSLNAASGGSASEHRQAFMTFGDKSWGSVKIGKDLGIYAADAILNDMTLLGVGNPANYGTTTGGRIGTGFQYADWKQQIAYTTPNFSGFQATFGITQAWNAIASQTSTNVVDGYGVNTVTITTAGAASTGTGGASPAYEGKASYSFAANDVTGKVWVSGFSQKVNGMQAGETAYSADIGANLKVAGLDLTGYYYDGEGTGATFMLYNGYSANKKARKVDGGYVQAKYTLPTKTVVGISWGESNLDRAGDDAAGSNLLKTNEMATFGLYHPLTKHVNLVAEYSQIKSENQAGAENKNNVGSLGGILFF
jgi:hypothetical protein